MIKRLVIGFIIALALLVVAAGVTIYLTWRGDPLPIAGPLPGDAPGTFYWVAVDPDHAGLSVWEQPAQGASPPVRTARLVGCPDQWCALSWMDVVDGEIHYVTSNQGTYLWRGELHEPLPQGVDPEHQLPAGVEVDDKTIYVQGKPVLTFPGRSGAKFPVGYYPRDISPDGRFLAFSYPGYASSDKWFLADLLGFQNRHSGNYAIDVETKAIYRLPDGQHLRWK